MRISRIYVESELVEGEHIAFDQDRNHYLKNVLRLKPGAAVDLFNGRDGEWRARLFPLPAGDRGDKGQRSKRNAALAQLVEHIIRNDGVRCSSHLSGTTLPLEKA